MAISKSLAKKLKWGVGIGAGAALMVTPVGWAVGATGMTAIAIDTAAGFALTPLTDKIQSKITKGANHFIDEHTAKGKAKAKKTADHKSDGESKHDATTHSSSAMATSGSNSASQVAASAAGSTTAMASNTPDPITLILNAITGTNGTNQNGRSVDTTLNKYTQDSQTLMQGSDKSFTQQLQNVGLLDNSSQSQASI